MIDKTEINNDLKRCATLMLAIGEDNAAEVFKHLNAQEVQSIGSAMAKMGSIGRSDVESVLEEFRKEADQFLAVSIDSNDYIKSALVKALGQDRAASLLEDILDVGDGSGSGIEALNWLDSAQVAELIGDEHPQIIAAIMVHLDRRKASEVLALLSERLRSDVIMRISTFGGVQPGALNELTEVLNEVLSGQNAKRSKMGGVRTAAEILNYLSSTEEEKAIKDLRELDSDLTDQILEEMFVFENLIEVEDSAIQILLKEIESNQLAIALKGVPENLSDKFYKNMSSRAAEMLREEIEMLGATRVSAIEKEQKNILMIAKRLADNGTINLSTNKDEYVE